MMCSPVLCLNSYFEMNFNITEAILYAFVFIEVDSKSDRSKLIKLFVQSKCAFV